jgi:hypothetical protein
VLIGWDPRFPYERELVRNPLHARIELFYGVWSRDLSSLNTKDNPNLKPVVIAAE